MSNQQTRHPVVLLVLDGWGYREEREGNAIELAETPVWHRLWSGDAPRTLLEASGLRVGLPECQMGNSEVGHLNLGAGRVVRQDLVRIDQAIAEGDFARNEVLRDLAAHCRSTGGTLHLLSLLGAGGVHAIDRHLLATVEVAVKEEVPRIAIQGMLDGRDSPPTSAAEVVDTLRRDLERIAGPRVVIASLTGRYFAMDRDHRWDRTRKAWDALVHGRGSTATDPVAAIHDAYGRGETDEFIPPIVLTDAAGSPHAPIRPGDAIFCVNYRSDRMRQIVSALAVGKFDGFPVPDRPKVPLGTMTQYDRTFPFPAAFPPVTLTRILAEVLADRGRTQFRTAETEKYPHVTYFFNGGVETPFPNEERELIPSQKVATYDLAPEMSAAGITDALCRALHRGEHDFLLCNLANADMVGHTGVLPAVIRAVETVDACLERIVGATERAGARLLITADHGNCETMIDPDTGGIHTAHTSNPVPFLALGTPFGPLRPGGALADVAPTVLHLLGLESPTEMTGRSLDRP